jgi:hypothetical protein
MFKDKLYSISKDLEMHHRSRTDMMSSAITERLDNSLKSYIDSINESYDYLKYRGEVRILNKMNRGRKKDDKSSK